jgi:hypothetical protein
MEPPGLARPVHDDTELCNFLLGSVQTTFKLNITKSKIHEGGSGLATTNDIPLGSEIFRAKEPWWAVPKNDEIEETCDNCFSRTRSMINSSGQFYTTRDEPRLNLMACGGCKFVRYCCKVGSAQTHSSLRFLHLCFLHF